MSSSYDDLQRFRDKTQTNNISFQEIATPKARSSGSDWNMINQVLSGDQTDTPFPATVNTHRPAPETVGPGMFALGAVPDRENTLPARPLTRGTETPVATTEPVLPRSLPDTGAIARPPHATEAPALLKVMADIPAPQAAPVTPSPEPARVSPPVEAAPQAMSRPLPAPEERRAPPAQNIPPAPETPLAADYAAMFAPAAVRTDDRAAVRELSLQSVLERIASCR